ncbi:MAG TPA: TGS domain-containing protein [Firmicutes bacterium]|nr:TGS domain-containing protein [Candidatus Fermentithermobacillaceae bacterium]
MSANLGPEFLAAKKRHQQAITSEEKLAALEEMLATIPKHKATEKMQGQIKRRMSKLRNELKSSAKKGPARREFFRIDKEGAGQVILVGPPNSGKSMMLRSMSKAEPEVAEYPFTTRMPLPGMARWENIQVQLIDMPPIAPENAQSWMWAMMRMADGLLLVFDMGDDDVLEHCESLIGFMEENNVRIKNDGEREFTEMKAMCAANKMDMPGAVTRLELFREIMPEGIEIVPCSAATGDGLSTLACRMFFELLDKIRIFTRPPGGKADYTQPFVVDNGTTVLEAAAEIHKEIAENLKYARVWGKGVFEGQMVPRDHVLHDGDVIVFYT